MKKFLLILLFFILNKIQATPDFNMWIQFLNNLKKNQSSEIINLLKRAERQVRSFELETNQKIKKHQQKASAKIKRIKDSLDQSIENIQKHTEFQISKIKKTSESEAKEISEETQQEVSDINEQFKKIVSKLKKDAALKILKIINEADEEAFKIRKVQRSRKALTQIEESIIKAPPLDTFDLISIVPSFIPITQAWKNSAINEFDTNTSFLKQIIMSGEIPEQTKEFINLFERQKLWFDKTLQATKYVWDKNYNKITRKNELLNRLVTATKKSDQILEPLELNYEQKNKIRLNFVYEACSLQRQDSALSNKDIKNLTIKIIEKITNKKELDLPELKLTQFKFAEKFEGLNKDLLDLQITNRELLHKIRQTQKNTTLLETRISNLERKTKEKSNKIKILTELCEMEKKEALKISKKPSPPKVPELSEANLIKRLEQEGKQKLQLELEILKRQTKD